MIHLAKRAVLHALGRSGAFAAIKNSRWRSNRLLILCYHGFALDDEHLWRPLVYMQETMFEQRLEALKRGGYNVLPLGEALARVQSRDLPPRSVVLTFDDGGVDFYRKAFPLLNSYGFPATVYQTTYYSDRELPVFNLMVSYLLWKRRGTVVNGGKRGGFPDTMDLRTDESRRELVINFVVNAEDEDLSAAQKQQFLEDLAKRVGVEISPLLEKRLFQLMNRSELQQLASEGIDFQLHTHRHRTPVNEGLFRKEIRDNRASLAKVNSNAVHFCYPSGVHRPEFLTWLKAEGVVSATTCDVGLVSTDSNPLLLPRLVDTVERSAIDFESWLTGVGALLAFRKSAGAVAPPAAGRASRAAVQ